LVYLLVGFSYYVYPSFLAHGYIIRWEFEVGEFGLGELAGTKLLGRYVSSEER